MIIEINKTQAEAIVEYFEWEFLPYIQNEDNEVDNILWVANMCGLYKQVKNSLEQEKVVDKQQDVCYNDIVVNECDNTTNKTIEMCDCYHDDMSYIGTHGVCWGTKEKDPCYCEGDPKKCTFYPEKRG